MKALEPKAFSHCLCFHQKSSTGIFEDSTESRPPLRKPDSDKEAFKFGCFNYILAACGAATGYMQLKFNVISHSPGVDDWGYLL